MERGGYMSKRAKALIKKVDIFAELVEQYRDLPRGHASKVQMGFELLPYLMPKLRSVEVTGEASGSLPVQFNVTIGSDAVHARSDDA